MDEGSPSYLSLAIKAAPKAPIIPAMSGLTACTSAIFQNFLKQHYYRKFRPAQQYFSKIPCIG